MNELQTFHFESRAVRVVQRAGEPWWVAADVCHVLDIENASMAAGRLDDDERGISSIDTPSGTQEMIIINESGLYSLILTSRKPEAKRFKKWITSEVLPALRKSGRYEVPLSRSGDPAEDPLVTQARLHLEAVRRQVELGRQLGEVRAQVGLASTHMTLMGWCSVNKIQLSQAESKCEGKFLARMCRNKGLAVRKVADIRYGEVNAYPVEVLAEWQGLYEQAAV